MWYAETKISFFYNYKNFWEELILIFSLHKFFEMHELNLIEINLSKLTLTSFNSI
jgi:hypothetical protein